MPYKVLFVCLGNICRSPTAEGVLRKVAADAGLNLFVDSAGTGAWHVGEPPDPRAAEAASQAGYDLTGQTARQIEERDFQDFDLILAMDQTNLSDIKALCPPNSAVRLRLLMDCAPAHPLREVPDPYYNDGFDDVVNLIEHACKGLVKELL